MKSIVALALALLVSTPAAAVTLVSTDFSGSINAGSANVKVPFTGNGFTQGMPFSGSFVFDSDVAVPGSGFANISFNNLVGVPDADAFQLDFGPLSFSLADHIDSLVAPAVQYNNGQFNGFVFVADFQFQSAWYQLRINGRDLTVRLLDGVPNAFDVNGFPTGTSLINARVAIGNANLTNQAPYPPPANPIPEPATWAMMIAGFGLAGAAVRRRRTAALRVTA